MRRTRFSEVNVSGTCALLYSYCVVRSGQGIVVQCFEKCCGKLLLKVMHYNSLLLPKK